LEGLGLLEKRRKDLKIPEYWLRLAKPWKRLEKALESDCHLGGLIYLTPLYLRQFSDLKKEP